jgi:hypothetical protein
VQHIERRLAANHSADVAVELELQIVSPLFPKSQRSLFQPVSANE